ncbi:hypothetical protein RD792_005937 [Penstemon davidsonii]|uniref:Myb-like domain-containing protein n=1 Tax=Penstemon davidsonii TaxID=160366 RepID=A0ABR0DDV9_9LAMI|nr:hypothetical protein RD792_005937 [Penstemon davidsonii]
MIPHPPTLPPFSGGGGGADDDDEFPRRDERFPQWHNQETRDFIEIRAQLEWDFNISKRNKDLWQMVVNRMMEKGYRRTIEQCKCKWKSLVNKYKVVELEASATDNGPLCPFFNELNAFFTSRATRMQQVQLDSPIQGNKKRKHISEDQPHEEETQRFATGRRGKQQRKEKKLGESLTSLTLLQETLRNFFDQQQMIDMKFREIMEKREQERELFEHEWRQTMENHEKERLVIEQAWREREEQRRLREESRAEKRDALLTALLNRLIRDENR